VANCIILTGGTWNRDNWSKIQRSVGPYRISTALEQVGYSTFVLDYMINFTLDEIKEVLKKHLDKDTLWVGFSSTFFWLPEHSGNGDILKLKEMWWTQEEQVQEIINYIKKNSSAKIVYGGTKSEFFTGKESAIDYYMVGLADIAVIAMTDYIKTGDESNLPFYKKHGDSYSIDCREYPEPAMNDVRTNWWNRHFNVMEKEGLPIELARGCIFKCKFCTYPLLGKKKGTYLRDAKQIRDDMMRNYDTYGTTDYFITDDTVNDDNDKIEELHRELSTLPFKPNLTGFFRLDLIHKHRHQAELLADMGVVGVFFGIETLHHESAKSIGKGLHPNKVKDCLNWLAHDVWKNRVNIGGGIILGLPHDTLEYFEEVLAWSLEPDCPMDHIQFYPLHLNDAKQNNKNGMYVSEFNLNPEIYGYEFPGKDNYMLWELASQGLSYTLCSQISKNFNIQRWPLNKFSGFEVVKYLNIGVSLEDIRTLTCDQIMTKYDIPALNTVRINEYKQLLGLKVNTG
jgi:hypothetical protein